MNNIKIGTTGTAYKDCKKWYTFIVSDIDGTALLLKITSGEKKGKYSILYEDEIDSSIIFDRC